MGYKIIHTPDEVPARDPHICDRPTLGTIDDTPRDAEFRVGVVIRCDCGRYWRVSVSSFDWQDRKLHWNLLNNEMAAVYATIERR